MPRAGPGSVRRRPTAIFATATRCSPTWRAAASNCSRRIWRRHGRAASPSLSSAFENVGRAYLHFARNEPAYYSAMFESGVPIDSDAGLRQASERAFAVLRRASEALSAHAPSRRSRPPALMMSLHVWAMAHGVASLFARGDAGRRALPMSPEDLLEAGVLVYLRGLGLDRRRLKFFCSGSLDSTLGLCECKIHLHRCGDDPR